MKGRLAGKIIIYLLQNLNKILRKGILDTIWEDHTSLTTKLFDLSGGTDTIWTEITAEHQDRKAFKLNLE